MSDNPPLRKITPPATSPPPKPSSITNEASIIRHLTPENQAILKTLKTKASELAHQPSPQEPKLFLLYRLQSLRNEIAIRQHTRTTLPATEAAAREQIRVEQDAFLREESRLLKQGKFIVEDMQDSMKTAEQAYHADLSNAVGGPSSKSNHHQKSPPASTTKPCLTTQLLRIKSRTAARSLEIQRHLNQTTSLRHSQYMATRPADKKSLASSPIPYSQSNSTIYSA